MAKKKIPHRNKSPYGWWIASYILRFEYYDEDRRNPNRRCTAWENTVIIKAKDREEAYRKVMAIGDIELSECFDTKTRRKGLWHFEGPTSLLPIYDKLEDGAEILWKAYEGRTVKKVKSYVRSKKELETFDDTEPSR